MALGPSANMPSGACPGGSWQRQLVRQTGILPCHTSDRHSAMPHAKPKRMASNDRRKRARGSRCRCRRVRCASCVAQDALHPRCPLRVEVPNLCHGRVRVERLGLPLHLFHALVLDIHRRAALVERRARLGQLFHLQHAREHFGCLLVRIQLLERVRRILCRALVCHAAFHRLRDHPRAQPPDVPVGVIGREAALVPQLLPTLGLAERGRALLVDLGLERAVLLRSLGVLDLVDLCAAKRTSVKRVLAASGMAGRTRLEWARTS
eukprot:352835-Chlamydomonas_euryale.AAC.7